LDRLMVWQEAGLGNGQRDRERRDRSLREVRFFFLIFWSNFFPFPVRVLTHLIANAVSILWHGARMASKWPAALMTRV
jgi:hypothetical protein